VTSQRDYYKSLFKTQVEVDTYLNSLRYLDRRIAVWPPVEELLWSSHKLEVIKLLDEIAFAKQMPRPWTAPLTAGFKPNDRTFLKREGSDCSTHAFKPSEVAEFSEKDLKKKAETKGYRWMVQEFVPALAFIGEWRAILVGGRIVYTVHTRPGPEGEVEYRLRDGSYSLKEMSLVLCNC
jgi:hypothetical protein